MKINTKNGFLNKNGFNSSSDVCCHLTPCQYHCTTYKHSECRFFTAYPNTHMHTNVPPHIHQSTSAVIELPSGGEGFPPNPPRPTARSLPIRRVATEGPTHGWHQRSARRSPWQPYVNWIWRIASPHHLWAAAMRDGERGGGSRQVRRPAFEVWEEGEGVFNQTRSNKSGIVQEIKTQIFNIYDNNDVIILTQKLFFWVYIFFFSISE